MINKHFLMKKLMYDPLIKKNIMAEVGKQERLEKSVENRLELKQKKNQIELLQKIKT